MLPSAIKAEVKLTTGPGIALAARELDALAVAAADAVGLVAALFVGGDRDRDGRWILVDAADYQGRRGDDVAVARRALLATARTQRWLEPLRRHVDELWPPFLQAFADAAERGHAALVEELDALHRAGRLREALPRERVLGVEHAAAMRRLVEFHGEAGAGRIAQDLLAYAMAMAGYRKVTLNAVGVPDFVLEDCVAERRERVALSLAPADVERVAALCRAAGDERLARALEDGMAVKG
ncbi:MAG TPA: hypothetical protein VFP65_20410 [Anaeromyxobacteraceae bacterium]|nr:hypothetical protein [Anaeromyxobacteraceae bacterium]